jgi:hypothetical protein
MCQHWERVQELLNLLGYAIKEYDPDGMELIFMSDGKSYSNQNITPLVNEVKYRKSQCKTQTNAEHRLRIILQDYAESYTRAETQTLPRHPKTNSLTKFLHSRSSQTVKPVCYYIFTDGVWQGINTVADPICKLLEKIPDSDRRQVGISFIQFGNDDKGTKRLRYLDEGLSYTRDIRDIVDYEPCDGDILKMLLGSVNVWWDSANDSEIKDQMQWCED